MVEINNRPIPKVPALRGRTVVSLFFEDSTRTRLSFETAAKRLSADTMSFSVSASSVNKGESVRDTVETIEAMGVDAIVVRHKSSGVPHQIARWSSASVINGGDGWHQHPTQALLDAYTIRSRLGSLEGRHIGIVGDVKHSRVARSDIEVFTALGAEVTLVAPPTLLPPSLEPWAVKVSGELDAVLPTLDVCYLLRMQQERMTEALVPTLREYTAGFGLSAARADRLPHDALIMHPGPMNRGVEIASEVADLPNAVVTEQVANGVAVRMAVLFMLVGSGRQQRTVSGRGAPTGPHRGRERRMSVQHRAGRSETFVIKGGTLVDPTGERSGDIVVEDGRIVAVGPDLSASQVFDAGGCLVSPGLVDLHTHLRQPGREEAETIESGSRAAALGGYTAVLAMPNTTPTMDSAGVVREVLELGRRSLVDVHAAGAITVDRAGRAVGTHGRDGCARCQDLHRRRHAGSRTIGSCVGRWSTPPASASPWPSTARSRRCPRAPA